MTGRPRGRRSETAELTVWLLITIVIASQSAPGRRVPRRLSCAATVWYCWIIRPPAAFRRPPGADGAFTAPRAPRRAPSRRSAPGRLTGPSPGPRRACCCLRTGPRTARATPPPPGPAGPVRSRLARSLYPHRPASRGGPSRRRVPDRFQYRHREREENAFAHRIHARAACARAPSAASRSNPSLPRGAPCRLMGGPYGGPSRRRQIHFRGDGRGLCRAHLLYSAPGAPQPVRHDCERTLGGDGWRRRRPGPPRPGDGETVDGVPSALEHTAVPGQARRAATSLPIEVRPPLRHSSGGCHWALAGTRPLSAASGAQATRDPSRTSRGAPRKRRRCCARSGRVRPDPLVPAPLPTPVARRPRRRHA